MILFLLFLFRDRSGVASVLQVQFPDPAAVHPHFADSVFQVHVDFLLPEFFVLFEKAVHVVHQHVSRVELVPTSTVPFLFQQQTFHFAGLPAAAGVPAPVLVLCLH